MQNTSSVPIPDRMKKLAVWHGFPIPYVNVVNDGVPDFRCTDQLKMQRCMNNRRCGICGQEIPRTEWCYFISGEEALEDRLFMDPAMHRECAYYAAKVCPFLAGTKRQHAEAETKTERALGEGHFIKVVQPRPKRLIIYSAKRYEVVQTVEGVLLCRPAKKPSRIDRDAMPPSREE